MIETNSKIEESAPHLKKPIADLRNSIKYKKNQTQKRKWLCSLVMLLTGTFLIISSASMFLITPIMLEKNVNEVD